MNRKLVDLERNPTNTDLIKEIFRASHTLKGEARMLNLIEIGKIAHEMESVFVEVRDGHLPMNSEITEVFFEALAYLEALVGDATSERPPSMDIEEIIPRIRDLMPEGAKEPEPPKPAKKAESKNNQKAEAKEDSGKEKSYQGSQNGVSNGEYISIAVDLSKLDTLMNITSELVLTKMESQATLENLRTVQDILRQRQRISNPVRNLIGSERSNHPF
jgi:two-component system, chemotaxis family, sensor kinase CheA